jgi:ABC-type glycerol-3-phosphate transport system substrate-binding protein
MSRATVAGPASLGRLAALVVLVSLASVGATAADSPEDPKQQPVEVEVYRNFYDPNFPDRATCKRLIELMEEDPQIRITQWGGLSLPGGGGRAALMMAIAGKTAPDIMESWFHVVGNDIRQGFLYPLNEWIGDDIDGNGLVDPEEATWDGWAEIPPLWRKVVTREGKVYGIPQSARYYMGVIFRMDMIRAAGLDPDDPPKTWDELI